MQITLRPHQQSAYNSWVENGTIGTVKAPTGSGKSIVGLYPIQLNSDSIWIIVHTVALQEQWSEWLKKIDVEHGLLGNGFNDTTKPVTIAIINSKLS